MMIKLRSTSTTFQGVLNSSSGTNLSCRQISRSKTIRTLFTEGISLMLREKVEVSSFINLVVFTRENGVKIKDMEWALKYSVIKTFLKVNMSWVESMVKANTLGQMVIPMMDNGMLDKNKVMASGRVRSRKRSMQVNGRSTNLMALVSILGRMEIFLRVNGRLV